ncbi:piggyBac transposable element-derived protein 4-like [Vespa velutina]|uniref:piggyBac transposable element-derived protein 4-like n=1 Tax=Vespa velutina TaxID=202808 RepID=UPI001FB49D80|nr:piggyBac transposable element-derived protein 4-like [Vespa velutina]
MIEKRQRARSRFFDYISKKAEECDSACHVQCETIKRNKAEGSIMSQKIKITSINENPSCPSDTDDSDIIPIKKSKKRIFSSSESDSDFSIHDDSCAEDSLRITKENTDNSEAEFTELEVKAFIAMILEMGITRRPNIPSYWSKNSRQILCSLCFPPSHSNYDPCVRFEPLVRHANRVFKLYYIPHKELSIDESLVGMLCHSSITQYMPNKKHHRWGITFWMLCDAVSKYCLTFYCYKDAKSKSNSDKNTFGLGYNVVVNLLNESNCLNKEYHFFVDNFFSNIELARYLYSNNTYLTGTIRQNKKCIPDHLKTVNVNEAKYFKDNNVLLCAYREKISVKKPVILISTKCEDKNVTGTKKRHDREKHSRKPAIFHSYNTFMDGVDESDKMLYTYLDEHRTATFSKVATTQLTELHSV